MRVFNTLTRTIEELVPQEENRIKIYACGPTVYNYIHVGNGRAACVF
ncbi:MAG: cysteinyl-tRNA synthetase, partial [Oscillospiraceae bacterium]|nr:cysteinyl-tRNA synthetase [Oscillospiraceae bacterium]